jgi:hypothetical protein
MAGNVKTRYFSNSVLFVRSQNLVNLQNEREMNILFLVKTQNVIMQRP